MTSTPQRTARRPLAAVLFAAAIVVTSIHGAAALEIVGAGGANINLEINKGRLV